MVYKAVTSPPKCVCPDRPYCMYPHVFPLGVGQLRSEKHHDYEAYFESRNQYLVDTSELKSINPNDYFTTTGDLITKLKVLEQDAFNLAFAAKRLLNKAKKTLGDSQYLETQVVDGKILCTAKTTKAELAKRMRFPRPRGKEKGV